MIKRKEKWFNRRAPSPAEGLTAEEVRQRIAAGARNTAPKGITQTVGRILFTNIFTWFNLIHVLIAAAIASTGHLRNLMFMMVAIANTLMGIVQELRAKHTLDKLAVLARGKVTVIRDGRAQQVDQQQVVLDDILVIGSGAQVCADGVVLEGEGLEVDESPLTGESEPVRKQAGMNVLSGSFVVAGAARVLVTAVGLGSFAGNLTVAAKRGKRPPTPLMRTLNGIIRTLTFAIVPVGLLLFLRQIGVSGNLTQSILGAATAVLGMIPEGLVLLTGLTLTLGAVKLARKGALSQSLPSIETLARVDVLCLDKTGTITDGTLSFERLEPLEGSDAAALGDALREMMGALGDENATAVCLREAFPGDAQWTAEVRVPFSSRRKWSGVSFAGKGSFLLGAPGFMFQDWRQRPFFDTVERYAAQGYRVLCLAHAQEALDTAAALPETLTPLGLVVLSDTIRPEAIETFRRFEAEGVVLKVISGDDALTVSTIAGRAGIACAAAYVDMSEVQEDTDFAALTADYTVFGRVSPWQKQRLIQALKSEGHTVCMTGDGVNDILAMKAADCSVAMIGGSEAARGACDFVLMTSDFSAMIQVMREGRRVINNIEKVASVYLVKTIYSAILALVYLVIGRHYPFSNLQMTLASMFTVGIPTFLLALRGNYHKPEGRFVAGIVERSLPAALTIVCAVLAVQGLGSLLKIHRAELASMDVVLIGSVGLSLLYEVSKPLRNWEKLLLCGMAAGFFVGIYTFGEFFMLEGLLSRNAFMYMPLALAAVALHRFLAWRAPLLTEKIIARLQKAQSPQRTEG